VKIGVLAAKFTASRCRAGKNDQLCCIVSLSDGPLPRITNSSPCFARGGVSHGRDIKAIFTMLNRDCPIFEIVLLIFILQPLLELFEYKGIIFIESSQYKLNST
jgi:hypothetical protein